MKTTSAEMTSRPPLSENGSARFAGFLAVFGPGTANRHLQIPNAFKELARTCVSDAIHQAVAVEPRGDINSIRANGKTYVWAKGNPYVLRGSVMDFDGDTNRELWAGKFVDLDGKFSLGIVDTSLPAKGSMRAIFATDIIGAGPIFYARQNGRVFVSTHYGWLLRNLDRMAMNRFGVVSVLTSTALVDGRTCHPDCFRLSAGTYLDVRCSGDGASVTADVRRYADPANVLFASGRGRVRSHEEALSTFDEVLHQAVSRHALTDGATLQITGGFDSRAISLALTPEQRHGLQTLTYTTSKTLEWRVARATARRLNLPHSTWRITSDQFDRYRSRIIELSGGLSGLQTFAHLGAYEHLAGQSSHAIVGFLGDVLTGGHLKQDDGNYFQTVLDTVCHSRRRFPNLAEHFPAELKELDHVLRSQFESCQPLPQHQRAMLLDLAIRQATYISASFDLADSYMDLTLPFYDRELMQFLVTLDESYLVGQRLYRDWFKRTSEPYLSANWRSRTHNRWLWVQRGWWKRVIKQPDRATCFNWPRLLSRILPRIDAELRATTGTTTLEQYARFVAEGKHPKSWEMLVLAGLVQGIEEVGGGTAVVSNVQGVDSGAERGDFSRSGYVPDGPP